MMKWITYCFLGLVLTACWPKSFLSMRDSSLPEEWKDFYIQQLELNTATAPANYGNILSEDLRTGVQTNTRLKLSPSLDSADVKISGVVTAYNTSPIAIQQGDNASKNRLTISVQFTILSPSKGLEEQSFTSTRFADYESTQQLSDVEQDLLISINQQIRQDVVNKLLSNW